MKKNVENAFKTKVLLHLTKLSYSLRNDRLVLLISLSNMASQLKTPLKICIKKTYNLLRAI